MEKVKAGFVLGDNGRIFVQMPEDNQFGFVICDEESSWAGGVGSGLKSWVLLDPSDPRITDEDAERLGWILEDQSVSPDPVRFTYEVEGRLSIAGQDAAYGVCMALEKDQAKDGTLTKEVYEKAAKLLNEEYQEDYQKQGEWTAKSIEDQVKNCTFGRWDSATKGMSCNHENVSHATSSSWESVCADCGEIVDKAVVTENEDNKAD